MQTPKKGFFERHLIEIRETIFPTDEQDTPAQKMQKKIGWFMFLLLMGCGMIAMLIAVSFAH